MARVDIRGSLVPNDYAFWYDFFEKDYTCPRNVQKILNDALEGEDIDVYINSPGGIIDVGSEIYTMLRGCAQKNSNVHIYITGEACSAASVVAMAGYCEMAPTSLMMVHCVSTYGGGNHSDFEHAAEMLRTADQAMASAYVAKSGMSMEDALAMMENETWLTANMALEKGLIDKITFEEPATSAMTNGLNFKLPSKEQLEDVRKKIDSRNREQELSDFEKELEFVGTPFVPKL